jgi:hypothetical protein
MKVIKFYYIKTGPGRKKGGLRKEALNMYLKEGLDESYVLMSF